MSDHTEADQTFLQHIRAELSRLRLLLTAQDVRYDDPTLLTQLRDALRLLIGQLESQFRSPYARSGLSYVPAEPAFRSLQDQLHQTSETIDALQLPLTRQHMTAIGDQLLRSQDYLDIFIRLHNQLQGDPEIPEDDPVYVPEEQAWYPHDFPVLEDIAPAQALRYQPDISVVLMTVTEVEFRAVLHKLDPWPGSTAILQVSIDNETYYLGRFGTQSAVVTTSRMGSVRAGGATHATDRACRLWRPRAVLMIGIAFGANPGIQRIGDVLVADQLINYEPQRLGSPGAFRGDPILSAPGLVNRFQHTHTWTFLRPDQVQCRHFVGPLLSGEKLIDDPIFKARLLQQFDQAIGGEMEGAGLSASSLYNNTPWILIKAICDWADGSKHKRHQPLAAAAATSLAYHVLNRPDALNGFAKSTAAAYRDLDDQAARTPAAYAGTLPTQADIDQQRQLLDTHRATLARYLRQRAQLGTAHEPPAVANGIADTRAAIQRCKATLRSWDVAVEDLPDDLDHAERAGARSALRRTWSPRTLVAAAVLLIAFVFLTTRLLPIIAIWGNGNITNTGPGSITINQGDSPEVRQQKLDQAKQLLIDDIFSNLRSLDSRLQTADTALIPIADPLAVARQTVAPLGGTPATAFNQHATAHQADSIRAAWANQPIRVVVDPPLVQVLVESGVEPSSVRTFYGQMSAAQDAGDGLLTTIDSAARNAPDQRSRDYWAQRIAVDHDILRNSARGAYAVGLQTLAQLGASPEQIASSLSKLTSLTPPPPLSDTQIAALRTEIDATTNLLDQRRLALLAAGQVLLDQDVATYTALGAQLVIADTDPADVVGVKASKLRRLGRTQEALAAFARYARLMADDSTTAQYLRTAQSLTQQPDLNLRGGIYIFALTSDGAAAHAGIQIGDVILTYDGSALALPNDLKTATELTPAGKPVVVEWMRLDPGGHWSMMHATLPAGPLGAGLMAI